MRKLFFLLIILLAFIGRSQDNVSLQESNKLISDKLNVKLNNSYVNFFFSINSDTVPKHFEIIKTKKDSLFLFNLLEGLEFSLIESKPSEASSSWKFKNFAQLKIYFIHSNNFIYGVICPSKTDHSKFIEDINLSGVDSRFLAFRLGNGLMEFERLDSVPSDKK